MEMLRGVPCIRRRLKVALYLSSSSNCSLLKDIHGCSERLWVIFLN